MTSSPASASPPTADFALRAASAPGSFIRRLRHLATILAALFLLAPATTSADLAEAPSSPAPASAPPTAETQPAVVTPGPAVSEESPVAKPEPAVVKAEPTRANEKPRAATPPPAPPTSLDDLSAWREYQRAAHLYALPDESRLFLRRAQSAARAGNHDEALRLTRGAAELDPVFVDPQLALASQLIKRDPTQAAMRYQAVFEMLRHDFLLQLQLVEDNLFFTVHGLFVGLVAVALIIVLLRHGELRHMWEERLKRLLHPASARVWAWALLALPFVMGMGVALAAAVLMGLLWPVLRPRERVVHGMLLAALLIAPFSGQMIGWMAAPMRADRAPLFGLAGLHDEAWSPERHEQVAALAKAHSDDPLAQFALGWSARLGGDLAVAEAAYRQSLAGWPEDSRVLNNLANVLAVRGEFAPAAELYRRSFAADPKNAAAYFNLSQVLTREFDFQAATDAVNRASAIDFEMVKTYQAMSTDDGVLPLADQWIDAPTLWKRVLASPPGRADPVLPFAWRGHVETSGLPFAAAVLVLGLGSVALGAFWQKGMPLRHCRNCGRVVCRRCVRHRREVALCPSCAGQEGRAESREFTEMLLARVRGQATRKRRTVRTVLALLIPGYGMLVHHQVISATLALVSLASLTAPWLGAASPFSYQAHVGPSDWTAMAGATVAMCVLLHLTSLIGYVAGNRKEADAAAARATPKRRRPAPPQAEEKKAA